MVGWGGYSYLQHVIQVERRVKHRAELQTKEARRTRMQELCNLLTNFALCFDRAHKEKRLSIQNRQRNSFQREGGGAGNKRAHVLSCGRAPVGPEGCRDWDRLTPCTLTGNRTTFVQTVLFFLSLILERVKPDNFFGQVGNAAAESLTWFLWLIGIST